MAYPAAARARCLLIGLATTAIAVLINTVLLTVRDIRLRPEPPDWSQIGGEPQMVLAFLIGSAVVALAAYVFVAVPLIVVWPPALQLRRGYIFLGLALLCPLAFSLLLARSLAALGREFVAIPGWFLITEFSALAASIAYVLLIRRVVQRAAQPL